MILFENFKDINTICQRFGLNRYVINSDGSIDVRGNVNLSVRDLTKIPLRFGKVTGYFWCDNNHLTTLEGSPREVGGDFWCNRNNLISLENGPEEVGSGFHCHENPIYEIFKLFRDYKQFKSLMDDYNYLRGNRIIRVRFQEACIEAGIEMPKKIEGYDIV